MNMKNLIAGFMSAGMLALSGTASAALVTIDFQAMADKQYPAGSPLNRGETVLLSDPAYDFTTKDDAFAVDGLAFTVSATGPTSTVYPYLDSGNAGLGVCSTGIAGDGTHCAVASDDNVTSGEALTLNFGQQQGVTLKEATFRNATHGTSFGGGDYFTLTVGAVDSVFDLAAAVPFADIMASAFTFTYGKGQFYIESLTFEFAGDELTEVPLPAAAYLFGSMLLGLFGLSRRRKTSLESA
jgi:hypothetical protein